MDKQAFYTSLRRRNSGVFGTSLSQKQVEGMEAIIDDGAHLPLSHLAYALATTYGETGGRMQPISENMNYTSARRIEQVFSNSRRKGIPGDQLVRNPEKLANTVYGGILGNGTDNGDGWRFRGRGFVQNTGRLNYEKVRALTGVDVVSNPDLALRIDVAAKALIAGIEHGIYTGKKASDYLPGDYRNARRIINGTFEADKYAGYARAFDAALSEAGYQAQPVMPTSPPAMPEIYPEPAPTRPTQPVDDVSRASTPKKPATGLLASLLRLFGSLKG